MAWKGVVRRLVLFPLRRLLRNHTYVIRQGLGRGLKRRGGLRFLPALATPGAEERFLRRLDLTGHTVCDIGAYEGVMTLFFGRAVGPSGRVFSFEPHPGNYRKVIENTGLNGFAHVQAWQVALGRSTGRASLAWREAEFGAGSIDASMRADIARDPGAKSVEVAVDSLDHHLAAHGLPPPTFVKIDVEGAELDVLEGMRQTIRSHKPALFIEIHGLDEAHKARNAREVLQLVLEHGYRVHHVQSATEVHLSDGEVVREGHLYCT